MATPATIEIATAIRAALAAVLGADTPVYARGVPTDIAGIPGDVDRSERKLPCVDIILQERAPHTHASVLRSFPFKIRVETWFPEDQFEVTLYTLAETVAVWICGPPSLNLVTTYFDALSFASALEKANAGENDNVQYMEWSGEVRTRKVV